MVWFYLIFAFFINVFQVLKKKYMEIEKQLKLEQENNEMLNKKQAILEDQIYSKELEIESLNSKYGIMIESRDTQIRSLQVIIFMLSVPKKIIK